MKKLLCGLLCLLMLLGCASAEGYLYLSLIHISEPTRH